MERRDKDHLETLGEVFTTEDYRLAAGIRSRGVPLGLRADERERRVVNVKPGMWVRVEPGSSGRVHVRSHADLRALYGGRPVRLSHRTAIQSLPVKAEGTRCVNTPFPISAKQKLGMWGVEQYGESEATFWKFAEHVAHNIWRSSKPRALLECAMSPRRAYEPLLVMAYGMDMLCEPEDLVAVASDLGWGIGLQRLQSVASELCGHWRYGSLNLHLDRFCRMLTEKPKRWTHLRGYSPPTYGHEIVYADYENRVWWPIVPDILIESLRW